MYKHILLFYGEDQQALQIALKNWREQFITKHGISNITNYEDGITKDAISTLLTPSLFGENRLFIITNHFANTDAETTENLLELLPKIPTENILIFVETKSLDKRKKTSKKILKELSCKEFPLKNKYNLPEYIKALTNSHNTNIAPAVADSLAVLFANNQQRLPQEINKLATASNHTEITQSIIAAIGAIPHTNSVFALTDALTQSSQQRVAVLHNLWQQGEDLLKLTYLLLNQIRLLIITHHLQGNLQGLTALKIHPFVKKKLKQSYHKLSLATLQTMQKQLSNIDINLKQGKLTYTKSNTTDLLHKLEMALLT